MRLTFYMNVGPTKLNNLRVKYLFSPVATLMDRQYISESSPFRHTFQAFQAFAPSSPPRPYLKVSLGSLVSLASNFPSSIYLSGVWCLLFVRNN